MNTNCLGDGLDRFVPALQAHLRESGNDYPSEVVRRSLTLWMESRIEAMLEDLPEVLTSPHMTAARQFHEILEQQMDRHAAHSDFQEDVRLDPAAESSSVFTGHRPYSSAKLGAMIAYIASSGRDVYKTSLNKLLFYSDLTHFYLFRTGISGATYVNLPYGPVPEGVEKVMDDLAAEGRIRRGTVRRFGANATLIKPGETTVEVVLTDEEKAVLDWVIERYGNMSASEISELSHREKAYSNTRPGEPIAYEYAKFLSELPDAGH